jgi:hypothetical protein
MSTLLAEKRALPPMGGLAIMAAELAGKRCPSGVFWSPFGGMTTVAGQFNPSTREACARHEQTKGSLPLTSSEYYRIIDRIARGQRP